MAWDTDNPLNTAAMDKMAAAFLEVIEAEELDEEESIVALVLDIVCDALGYEPKAIVDRITDHIDDLADDDTTDVDDGPDTSIDERDETPALPDPQRSLSVEGRSGV